MKKIAPEMYWVEGLRSGNVYLLETASGLCLIDTGMAGDVKQIVSQIEEGGFSANNLEYVILTHSHSDHSGGVSELVRRSAARVLAHREEQPYIEGTKRLPSGSVFQEVFMWMEDRFAGKMRTIIVNQKLEDGDILDEIQELHVFHVPGHTPGSICLYQKEKKILFAGDLLFNGNPFTGRGGLRFAPRMFSVNPENLVQSAKAISSIPVKILCPGHGIPISKESPVPLKDFIHHLL